MEGDESARVRGPGDVRVHDGRGQQDHPPRSGACLVVVTDRNS